MTDALLRKVNVEHYDDRAVVQTNLIESFDQLTDFACKHLPDKFFIEGMVRVSLRNIIVREMISNTLMHREFTSTYISKFIIMKDRMYVENANRFADVGSITPENFEPNPKNPIIASFFRNIGYADGLGSGTTKLFNYTKFYSGKDPELKEGDIFRIIVPLDDQYSYDATIAQENTGIAQKDGDVAQKSEVHDKPLVVKDKLAEVHDKTAEVHDKNGEAGLKPDEVGLKPDEVGLKTNGVGLKTRLDCKIVQTILNTLDRNPTATISDLCDLLDTARSTITYNISRLKEEGLLKRVGPDKGGHWEVLKVNHE